MLNITLNNHPAEFQYLKDYYDHHLKMSKNKQIIDPMLLWHTIKPVKNPTRPILKYDDCIKYQIN